MIISRTPFRVSFFGGGTDYPAWYLEEGGAVLSTTIDKYCYITCRYLPPFFEIKHRVVWRHVETVLSIADILHPAVREGLKYIGFDDSAGLEIHYQGDLPARAGLGSSSAFAVGLIHALTALRGSSISKRELALKAIELERDVLKEHVGSQDQVATAYGGLNLIRFHRDGSIEVQPVAISESRRLALQSRLLMFYSGRSRGASAIAAEVVENIPRKHAILRQMRSAVDQGAAILNGEGSLDDFGRLLHESWQLKRELSPNISNPTIDEIYNTAMANGTLGGKLLGAGASGFMLFYVPAENQGRVCQALAGYLQVPFKLEDKGSVLIYGEANGTGATLSDVSHPTNPPFRQTAGGAA